MAKKNDSTSQKSWFDTLPEKKWYQFLRNYPRNVYKALTPPFMWNDEEVRAYEIKQIKQEREEGNFNNLTERQRKIKNDAERAPLITTTRAMFGAYDKYDDTMPYDPTPVTSAVEGNNTRTENATPDTKNPESNTSTPTTQNKTGSEDLAHTIEMNSSGKVIANILTPTPEKGAYRNEGMV